MCAINAGFVKKIVHFYSLELCIIIEPKNTNILKACTKYPSYTLRGAKEQIMHQGFFFSFFSTK